MAVYTTLYIYTPYTTKPVHIDYALPQAVSSQLNLTTGAEHLLDKVQEDICRKKEGWD